MRGHSRNKTGLTQPGVKTTVVVLYWESRKGPVPFADRESG